MGFLKDAAGWVGDKASDVKNVVTDDIAPTGLEAFRTAAWAGSEMLASPVNNSAHMLSAVTGKDVPQLHLVGKSDSVNAVEDKLEPVLNAVNYVGDLRDDFTQATAYAAVQQTVDGVSQLTNKVAGTEVVPHLDLIEKPEAADKWSPEWIVQQGGLAVGTAAPILLGGSGIAARLGPRAMAMAGVEVTAESGAGVQLATKVAGSAPVSFGYNFFMRPSTEGENFWESRLTNGSIGAFLSGGQTALRASTNLLNGLTGEAVHTAVDTNARSALKGDGLAAPEDYVQGGFSKAASTASSAVSGDG